jgi:tetratricopeptide (TPR) repeat protein
MADQHQAERSIFLVAVEIDSPAERAAFLDRACAGNQALRAEVEALLQAHDKPQRLLDAPVVGAPTTDEPSSERPGTVIGPYKLVQELGEGGMGTVYMAQRAEPVKRLVALKVIKAGMDSRQVIARFEAERQALALMDHPNIARVFDAGTTDTGRPYFVMELVKGVPLTKYCDEHRLTPKQRLELFIPVCQAIQHAHQKGVIHRDIKPSNVLVALYDGKPVPKVIDFGVAKATGQPLTERTLITGFGAVVGTLEYMSPEQAELNQLDIDTRSDIYSLGVLLYELLTGSTPLDKKRLKEAAMLEVLRIIREEEPPKPSTRLNTTDELPSVAANRGLDPKKLSGLLRGELDWVVMKCLEKDRTRRYETANGLAQDIQRYLVDEPVQACPPSAWYRFRKFVRRNRTALTVAGLILCVIALVGGGAGWVLRDRAARQARAVNELEQTLERADFFQGQGKRAEALAALERAESLVGEAPPDPARDARLAALKERLAAETRDQQFIARFEDIRLRVESQVDQDESYFNREAALPKYRNALGQYGIAFGVTAPAQVADRIQGRPERVRRDLVAALDECFRFSTKDAPHIRKWLLASLAAADNDAWRVRVRKSQADADRATLEQLAREVDARDQPPSFLNCVAHALPNSMNGARLKLFRRIQRAYPADLWANHWLAYELTENGQFAEAIRYYTAALALRPRNPGIYLNRGCALRDAGELDAAIADLREARALAPKYANVHANLGVALAAQGHMDEAIAAYREAIRLKPGYSAAHANLGHALAAREQWEEAIAAYHEAIRFKKDNAPAHNGLGSALNALGQVDDAIKEFREALRIKEDFAEAHSNLGTALVALGQVDDGIAECREAIRLRKDFAGAHCNLGSALHSKGRFDEAIAAYHEAIRLKKDCLEAQSNIGCALFAKGQVDDAIAAYHETLRINKGYAPAHHNLGEALYSKGQLDDAIAAFREAIRLKKDYAKAHVSLGSALSKKGRLDDAIAAYREAIRINKGFAAAHFNLGLALCSKEQLDEAITAFREAIQLKKDAATYYSLGNALWAKVRVDEAIAAYREAIRLQKDYAEAHCNLSVVLNRKGELRKALEEARRGHELGKARGPRWRYPSEQHVRRCERMLELDGQLSGFLDGTITPRTPVERFEVAGVCFVKGHHRAAARFFKEAFAAERTLENNLDGGFRYLAASSAALAGSGQGKDTTDLDGEERARLRQQALDWLRADLEAWSCLLDRESDRPQSAYKVTRLVQPWLDDPAFAGVRGTEGLAKLPEVERRLWQRLWGQVADTLARARGQTNPHKKKSESK